ncbi:MAG: lytic transglycosylase domain-containing protein [Bacillota bacterium]
MELELLVRLMQMQMYSNTYNSRKSDSGFGGSSNFALILSALMDSPGGSGAAGLTINRSVPSSKVHSNGSLSKTETYSNIYKAKRIPTESLAEGLEGVLNKASAKYGIEPDLLRAVIKVESDFNPFALSSAGAMGLMQLMPGTARSLGVNNPYDVKENIEGGAKYLRSLLDRFDGNIKMALAAYNAGPGAVERYGGVPPYRETVSYLQKINKLFNIF